jgi:hypothetical protein
MYNPDAYSASERSIGRNAAALRSDGWCICVDDKKPSVPPLWPEVRLGWSQFGSEVVRPMQHSDAISFLLRAVKYLILPGIFVEWDTHVIMQAVLTLIHARQQVKGAAMEIDMATRTGELN